MHQVYQARRFESVLGMFKENKPLLFIVKNTEQSKAKCHSYFLEKCSRSSNTCIPFSIDSFTMNDYHKVIMEQLRVCSAENIQFVDRIFYNVTDVEIADIDKFDKIMGCEPFIQTIHGRRFNPDFLIELDYLGRSKSPSLPKSLLKEGAQ